jgi:hypothetical protein
MTKAPSYLNFNKSSYAWKNDINYRKEPEKYKIGKGEQGVLTCEPYKSEILPFWRFKNRHIAKESSNKIYELFIDYIHKKDFIGADMARKFLQMGFTRARRFTNYKGGLKYDKADYHILEKGTGDPEKALSADLFFKKWKEAEQHLEYAKMKEEWKKTYG